jgi:hypothetical protein
MDGLLAVAAVVAEAAADSIVAVQTKVCASTIASASRRSG